LSTDSGAIGVVEDPVTTRHGPIKVKVVPGANGQTTDVKTTREGATYASALRGSTRTCARGAVTMSGNDEEDVAD
jgi:hypothetical protein